MVYNKHQKNYEMSRVSRTDYSVDKIAELEKKIQGIQDDIKGIKGDLDGFGRAIRSIEERLTRLELRPSPLRRVEERRSSKPGPLSGE